jgi:hypothetical protein
MLFFHCKRAALFFLFWAAFLLFSCRADGPNGERPYLIRVGQSVLSPSEFHEAYELRGGEIGQKSGNDRDLLQEARWTVLHQLTEELVLKERARELGLEVSDAELEKKIQELKSDYPKGVFEELLLEYAISYKAWREGVRKRLLMERLIESELGEAITLEPEEIAAYYNMVTQQESPFLGIEEGGVPPDEAMIRLLKRKKMEDAYRKYINELKAGYLIEVNQVQWEKILNA